MWCSTWPHRPLDTMLSFASVVYNARLDIPDACRKQFPVHAVMEDRLRSRIDLPKHRKFEEIWGGIILSGFRVRSVPLRALRFYTEDKTYHADRRNVVRFFEKVACEKTTASLTLPGEPRTCYVALPCVAARAELNASRVERCCEVGGRICGCCSCVQGPVVVVSDGLSKGRFCARTTKAIC